MKILHIADAIPSPDSGAAGTDFQSVQALLRSGHDVEAVWADELSHRIRHYNLRYLFELPYSYRRVVLSRIKLRHYDVIQISQPHGYLAAKLLIERSLDTVFVHRSHGLESRASNVLAHWRHLSPDNRYWPKRMASGLVNRLLELNSRQIAKYADGHLVSARDCADFLNSAYKIPRENVGVVAQGVSEQYLRGQKPVDAGRMRKILYVGQLAFFKAPMLLGQVVGELLIRHPELSFTWVCAAKHHAAAAAHLPAEVMGRVKFLDWIEQERLVEIYDQHGLFLFPSFFEGFGKVFLEAMSRGLIVVAARNSAAKDVIDHDFNGLTVETGNAVAMVNAADRVLGDLDLAIRLSQRALETAAMYTWDRYAARCVEFYESLIARRNPALGV